MAQAVDVATAEERRQRLGAVIRAARQERGWSQTRLAREIEAATTSTDVGSLTQSAISQWENGETAPKPGLRGTVENLLGLERWTISRTLEEEPDGVAAVSRGAYPDHDPLGWPVPYGEAAGAAGSLDALSDDELAALATAAIETIRRRRGAS